MTAFPSSFDTFVDPDDADYIDDPAHDLTDDLALIHSALAALEAKMGIDSSADPTSQDYQLAQFGLVQTYVPVVSQGIVTMDTTAAYAKYQQIGDKINVSVWTTAGPAFTGIAGDPIIMTIPVNMVSTSAAVLGSAFVTDGSAFSTYPAFVTTRGGTEFDTVQFTRADAPSFIAAVGNDPNFAMGNTDDIICTFSYWIG